MTTPNRPEHEDYTRVIAGTGGRFQLQRRLAGYAYPANGNVHNPTPRYEYNLLLDGSMVDTSQKAGRLRAAAKSLGAVKAYSA